jgi:DNA-binding CsgD family transcriptional regulator
VRIPAFYALGLLALGSGDAAAAVDDYSQVRTLAEQAGVFELGTYPWCSDLVEALVRLGRRREARDVARPLLEADQVQGRALVSGLAARVRALLAPSTGDEADHEFERSSRSLQEVDRPFERARTRLCYGEHLRRRQRPRRARVQLRSALGAFDRLGATDWSDRAAGELAAAGDAFGLAPTSRGDLTPRELQVGFEIARGATVREAGNRLFISPKTVEYHLNRIYRKLGVHSREGLRDALDGPAPDASTAAW